MISFGTNNRRKHTKSFFPLLVALMTIWSSLSASELNFSSRMGKLKEAFPFEHEPGYVPGGRELKYSLRNERGEEFFLIDLRGKVVVVILSTTWCPNCPVVLRRFDNLAHRLGQSGIKNVEIVVLNVGQDSTEALKLYYKSNDIQLLKVYPSVPISVMKGITGVPACFVFDKKGDNIWGYLGGANYDGDEFFNFMERLANE